MHTATAGLLTLPVRRRGRQSADAAAAYDADLTAWCEQLQQIASSLEFRVSSRGWCYILEEYGLGKGDFDKAQTLINDCRKAGRLPLTFCAEDNARDFDGLEELDAANPEDQADRWFWALQHAHEQYTPVSFWADKTVYLQLLVEKVDLKSLFAPICREFRIPNANARGWADINGRAAMMRRFRDAERRDQQPVLLYCGDHDPAGLLIAETIRKNLADLSVAVGWRPDTLVVDRFGLNADFIEAQGLTWIDGLETGSGTDLSDATHNDHQRAYVQDYLRRFGARKVEANALVTRAEAGRQLLRDTIAQYLSDDAPAVYEQSLVAIRQELREVIAARLRGDV